MVRLPRVTILSLIFVTATASCQNTFDGQSEQDWLIPREEVFDGGPPKDGIPALTSPKFIAIDEVTYLDEEDLVIGMMTSNGARAYPHAILDWHEIVNDSFDDTPVSLTYCPLTGSGIAWDGQVNNRSTTFGVSGMIYSTNLIAYDRYEMEERQVLRLDLNHKPGSFAAVASRLGAAGINIDYCYATMNKDQRSAAVIIDVQDPDRAFAVLEGL